MQDVVASSSLPRMETSPVPLNIAASARLRYCLLAVDPVPMTLLGSLGLGEMAQKAKPSC